VLRCMLQLQLCVILAGACALYVALVNDVMGIASCGWVVARYVSFAVEVVKHTTCAACVTVLLLGVHIVQ
jgi:hypothetical protein